MNARNSLWCAVESEFWGFCLALVIVIGVIGGSVVCGWVSEKSYKDPAYSVRNDTVVQNANRGFSALTDRGARLYGGSTSEDHIYYIGDRVRLWCKQPIGDNCVVDGPPTIVKQAYTGFPMGWLIGIPYGVIAGCLTWLGAALYRFRHEDDCGKPNLKLVA